MCGAKTEEPTAFDPEEPHLMLGVIDHQTFDRADVFSRIIQEFPAPDVLIGVLYCLAYVT
jgi:hypothetical protein